MKAGTPASLPPDPSAGQTVRVARTPKLTPVVHKGLVAAVKDGVPRKYAAQAVGIGESTLRLWLSKGRRQKAGPYVALLAAIKKAEGEAVRRNVRIVRKAAAKTWTAAAWWLERRYPDEFARREPSVTVRKVSPTEVVEVVVRNATPDRPADGGPAPVPAQ